MRRLALLAAITLLLPWQVNHAQPFRMAYIEGYPPLSWTRDGEPTGITLTILSEALGRRMGLEVRHTLYPWKRAQELVREGREDALITQPTPARREYAEIGTERIMSINYTLYVDRSNQNFDALRAVRRLDDLRPFVLGQLRGSQWAERNLEGFRVQWVTSIDQNLKKLAAGRIDGFIGNAYVTPITITRLGLQENIVEIREALLREIPYHLVLSKRSPHLGRLARFDEVVREMKADGTIDAIIERFLNEGR